MLFKVVIYFLLFYFLAAIHWTIAATVAVVLAWHFSPALAIILVVLTLILLFVVKTASEKTKEERRLKEERCLRALQVADVDNMDGIAFERYLCSLLCHR